MVEPSAIISLSSTTSSSNDNTFQTNIGFSSHQKPPLSKKTRGRPLGSKNKPKPPPVINQGCGQALKPIFIEVPGNSNVIEAVVQFARRYQVSITVLSALGSIFNATLCQTSSHTSTFSVHGPFTLISLIGTYINNDPCVASSSLSSSSNLDLHRSFKISFSSTSGQSFVGIVAGKVMAANKVIVVATTFKNSEIYKNGINDGGEEMGWQ